MSIEEKIKTANERLFLKQKMVDVGKLISFEILLVGEVVWFVLPTTSAPSILSHAKWTVCLEPITWQA